MKDKTFLLKKFYISIGFIRHTRSRDVLKGNLQINFLHNFIEVATVL